MKVCALCGRCYDDSVVSCTEDGSPILSKSRDGDQEMIAGYRLECLVESGIKGETYRARETESGRSCLIQILSADEIGRDQFLREARAAATFLHPNVVDVYETGSLDSGEFFVVAEDTDARNLRGFLNNVGVPDLLTSIGVIRQAAEALDALHHEGLVHRAVNPENILLTTGPDASPLVRLRNPDVGGVIQRSIVSNKFLIDSALDSLRYFAPEQCSGDEASAQTDVYSLGVVFYEMLAGKPPFDAAKAAGLIEKHRSQRPPDVRIDNFDLRMLVTHALMESLQKQPRSRQSSANLFARQMRHIEQLATHVSTPPPAGAVRPTPVRPVVRSNDVSKARPVIEPVAPEIREEEIQPVVVAVVAPPVVEIAVPRKTFSVRERLSLFTLRMKALLPEIQPRVDKVAGDKIITPTIEWQQPEDDIPSVAEVLKVRATEQIEEIPRVVPEEIAVMPVSIEPPMTEEEIPLIQVEPEEIKAVEKADTKHHWRRSPASARKTRLPSLRRRGPAWFSPTPTEQITPISVEPAKVEDEIPVIQVAPEAIPAKIEDEKPNTTIPIGHMRLEDVTAKPIRIRSEQTYARIPWVKDVLKSTEPNRIPRDELEEITLVRARKPITIDLDRPTTPYGARRDKMFSFDTPDAVRFVPTLLGNSEKRRTIDLDPKDAIFSAYGGQPPVPSRIRRRLIAAGSLSVALLIGFLFADDLGRLLEAASSGDTVATTASPTQQSLSPVATLSSAKKKDLKNPNKIEESKPVVTKDRAVRADEKSPTSAARKSVTDDVKTKPVVKPAKNAPDKTPPSTGNKPAPGTRPRVVDEP